MHPDDAVLSNLSQSGEIEAWITEQRAKSDLVVRKIVRKQCREWELKNGRYVHCTGRFFSLVGVEIQSSISHLHGIQLPIIDQPEIGILGVVIRRSDVGWEWLLQAKTEPGNMHGVQASLTVQATKSNYECVHHGLETPMIECFRKSSIPDGTVSMLDVEQSEQGDRFIGKFNRNCVVSVPHDYPVPASDSWKWFTTTELCSVLIKDYMINTDLRSVIFCSDWDLLTLGNLKPFERWRDQSDIGRKLFDSYHAISKEAQSMDMLMQKIAKARDSVRLARKIRSLTELSGWKLTDSGLQSEEMDSIYTVSFFDIKTSDREVTQWCQPLFESRQIVTVTILCSLVDDILHFYLRKAAEPGFQEQIQLAPSKIDISVHICSKWVDMAIKDSQSICYCEVMQSDEGGRFMNAKVKYRVIEIPQNWYEASENDGLWLSLGQIKKLANMKGYLTNETRSALSILLAWV